MAKEQKGLFPEQPGGGVQGLFEQSRRAESLANAKAATPQATPREQPTPRERSAAPREASAASREPSQAPQLPGSRPSEPARPTQPKKRRHRLGLWRFAPHIAIAVVALVGIANKHRDVKIDIPKVTRLSPVVTPSSSSGTPDYRTMTITASGGPIANGVYRATGAAVHGGGTRTLLEFAITGRGARQHVVYYAGFHVRDASCDRKPRGDASAGLVLYDDELTRSRDAGGRSLSAYSDGHDESIAIRAGGASRLTGTFRFHAYTGCPSGGSFTFTATRDPKNRTTVADGVWSVGG